MIFKLPIIKHQNLSIKIYKMSKSACHFRMQNMSLLIQSIICTMPKYTCTTDDWWIIDFSDKINPSVMQKLRFYKY